VAPGAQAKVFPCSQVLRRRRARARQWCPGWRSTTLATGVARILCFHGAHCRTTCHQCFEGLRARGGLSPDENAALVGRFVRDRRWDQAFVAWAGGCRPRSCPRLEHPSIPVSRNRRRASGPFEWNIGRVSGVDAGIRPSPDGQRPCAAHRVPGAAQRVP
jgi:hypothetical protein